MEDWLTKSGPAGRKLYFAVMFDEFTRRLEGGGLARKLLNGSHPRHPVEHIANIGRKWFMENRARICRIDMPDDFVEITADAFRAALLVMMGKIVNKMN